MEGKSSRQLLRWGARYLARRGVDDPARESRLLLALAGECPVRYRQLLGLRGRRVPFAHLSGHREFWSLVLLTPPDVLIPRPETETLVEAVLSELATVPDPLVADVGTGSGAVAVALATELARALVWGTDTCPRALAVARANALAHGVGDRIRLVRGHLLGPLVGARPFDAVVSNPPYVSVAEYRRLEPEVRCHEPPRALVGGIDGLFYVRRLVRGAASILRPRGLLAVEVGCNQRTAIDRFLAGHRAWSRWRWVRDLAGADRVVIARRGDG